MYVSVAAWLFFICSIVATNLSLNNLMHFSSAQQSAYKVDGYRSSYWKSRIFSAHFKYKNKNTP